MIAPRNRNAGQRADARWLSLVQSLMVGVSARDYVWSTDPRVEAQRLVLEGRRHAMVQAIGATAIVLVTVYAMHLWGFRQVSPAQERALAIVAEVDPDFEVDQGRVLAQRWGQRADAYRLVRIATAPSNAEPKVYPYLADLSGHPAPSVSPGNGKALVLLAGALDQYPEADTKRLLHRLVAIAASLDKPGVIDGMSVMAEVPPELRTKLFADGGAMLGRLVAQQAQIDADQSVVTDLESTLNQQQVALQAQRDDIKKSLEQFSANNHRDIRISHQCARHFRSYLACIPIDLRPHS